MKKLICTLVLSLVLTAGIVGLSFNTYHRFVPIPVVKEHKVLEAPIGQYLRATIGWLKGFDWSRAGYHPRFWWRYQQPEG